MPRHAGLAELSADGLQSDQVHELPAVVPNWHAKPTERLHMYGGFYGSGDEQRLPSRRTDPTATFETMLGGYTNNENSRSSRYHPSCFQSSQRARKVGNGHISYVSYHGH